MPEFVYALHNFAPEHEDEIAFQVGQPIEVIEKDEEYGDGWWQGRNVAGKVGLFPQSYTTSAPHRGIASTPSSASSNEPITTPSDSLSPLGEEPESASSRDAESDSRIGIAIGEPGGVDSEVMKATMTDVQKAIEQLGRSDRDGAQSFSFASTRDGDTDRETDGTETDGEIGGGWHRSARDKLAEQARKVVEAQATQDAAFEAQVVHERTRAPPIDVEMSDESEAEEDDSALDRLQHMHFTRDHPHIPEEEEEEDARRSTVARAHRRNKSSGSASAVLSKDDRSSLQEASREPTATLNRTSFMTSSSPPRSTRSLILSDRRSPRLRSTPTPDAVNIVAPVPIVPMGVHMIPMSTSPEPAVQATPTPSVNRDIPAALPSPALSAPGFRQHSRQTSQQNSISSVGKGSARTSAQFAPETEVQKKPNPPSEWTVDEVVEWLKSKGFGSDVYDRFIEQEITGDVLLELDINLLKAEIGIVAFGKRMRIANAIAELRRPSSIILSDQQGQSVTHPVSPSFSYPHSPSGSTQHSLNSPMFTSIGSTLNGPPSSTLAGPGSLESPKGDTFASPLISKRVSNLSSAGASVNGGSSAEGTNVAAGIERAGLIGAAGLGLGALTEGQLSSFPNNNAPEAKTEKTVEEERGAQSESESDPASGKLRIKHLFGLSAESSLSSKDKEGSETPKDPKLSSSPARTASPRIKRRESEDDTNGNVPARHARSKRSTDVSKTTERHSLFGGTFSTTIGRSRKPPPRVTSTLLEESSPTEKTSSLGLSRLYSSRKSSGRPSTSDGSTISSLRNGMRSVSESDVKKKEMERGKSMDKTRDQEKPTPKMKPTELDDGASSRKQTATLDGRAGSRGPNALKPGKSIIDQIGQPDYQGWMRKKGDHYNSWKHRYFIIKGPHLYVLRSNSKMETKIKGYVNIVGYKVIADENVDPGRYGFRIVHETDKTHYFSSEEQATVREWMKAIMKATIGRDYSKPVVSSVNIPTIPLTVAQAMNPAPRPPSPTARAAMQKALRRNNPNQLSSRDARILMGLPSSDNAGRIGDGQETPLDQRGGMGENGYGAATKAKGAPPRPSREARRASVSAQDLLDRASDSDLIEWANSHLPRSHQVTSLTGPLFGGLALLRLSEDMMGKSATPPIPDSAFPFGPNDDKLDGLFRLFDFLLDNDVKMGSVSINDIRQGKRDKVMQLLRALKTWEDRRKEIVKSIGQGMIPSVPTLGPMSGNSWR